MSTRIKCPHCNSDIEWNFHEAAIVRDNELETWIIEYMVCPYDNCFNIIIRLSFIDKIQSLFDQTQYYVEDPDYHYPVYKRIMLYPKCNNHFVLPEEVNESIAKDFNEAALILELSPKASAALSRRCLQQVLREKAGVKHGELSNEIQEVLDSNQLPTYLSKSIDAIRHIGNFAAHPIKSKSTGEIVNVEPGEAEWLIQTLEQLFDFYFVQLPNNDKKIANLNKKLEDAGKPRLKE